MTFVTIGLMVAAVVPLWFTWISFQQRDDQALEDRMADRISYLEQTLADTQATCDALRRENFELRTRILALEKGAI